MTEQEVLDEILDKHCYCTFCINLQKKVSRIGLDAIRRYEGMECPTITKMKFKVGDLDALSRK